MLRLSEVDVSYGMVGALRHVSMDVREGEIVALLGANGAGKTTTLRAISGVVRPASGSIEFEGAPIDGLSPERIVSLGIVQAPEGRQVFPELSAKENLLIGTYSRRDRARIPQDFARVYEHFPVLKERETQPAGTLSGGEQQMLAIGRALMASPKVLLLDEPSLGLAPMVTRQIFQIIKALNAEGTTILLVEQNARLALAASDRAYILETGSVVLSGPSDELLESEEVKRSYLGGGARGRGA
ncbi:MAG: ABC transporter ATP-binding protein [Firmicutes bacterium]|nr:ABC transporter ATP-binding protein [Bacillota bacterium]MDD4791629.1 ABC transporter ATP-binding protein [Bacillota bacterium]